VADEQVERHVDWTDRLTDRLGSKPAIMCAALVIIIWAPTVFFLEFDAWNFAINTTTTIITFLMVFVVQHTQNRSDRAVQTKLDALLVNHEALSCMLQALVIADDKVDDDALMADLHEIEAGLLTRLEEHSTKEIDSIREQVEPEANRGSGE
jgi:hypothetical protein